MDAVRIFGNLEITLPSAREVAMSRVFSAPRSLVFDAITKPELIKRWLSGPPGWTMTRCEVDLQVGGVYRYEWTKAPNKFLGLGGVFREIVRPERLVNTEVFDEAWYPGEAIITYSLVEQDGKTTLKFTVLCESQEARDIALKTPMETGVDCSYNTLAEVLKSLM